MKLFWSFLIFLVLIHLSISAQDEIWTTEFSDDGNVKVVYRIYDSLMVNGEEKKFIEYNAKTKTSASLENCALVFNNPDMHKKFYEYTEISERIRFVSKNEWIIYYYYSPPWPIADSDCVSRITMKNYGTDEKIVFTSISEPDLIEMKDVTRSELNNISFTFTKINNLEVEIFIEAILIPETYAPKWMMNAWFPEGPARILNRFKELAENYKE
jgi:hypothetical protein